MFIQLLLEEGSDMEDELSELESELEESFENEQILSFRKSELNDEEEEEEVRESYVIGKEIIMSVCMLTG